MLARRRKARKIAASLDLITHKEGREGHREHYHHLLKLQTQLGYVGYTPCATSGCEGKSLPFTDRCSLRILLWVREGGGWGGRKGVGGREGVRVYAY